MPSISRLRDGASGGAAVDMSFFHPEIKFGAPALHGSLAEIIGGGLARDLCLTGGASTLRRPCASAW